MVAIVPATDCIVTATVTATGRHIPHSVLSPPESCRASVLLNLRPPALLPPKLARPTRAPQPLQAPTPYPARNRLDQPRKFFRPFLADTSCQGEEIHHNSWTMGDPPEYMMPRVPSPTLPGPAWPPWLGCKDTFCLDTARPSPVVQRALCPSLQLLVAIVLLCAVL